MRPLKLVMTGFETYCDRTEIDFTKLGTQGLYLITGETGAGKTTIFDAITFALYGLPSGETRSESMLRSHFADETIPTEVELTFEAKGKTYRVKRNPEYYRQKERGEGTTKQTADASLEFVGTKETPVSGKENVTEKITEILNLGRKEFCCIAMIAQGAFQRLLLEKTDEKQKIFRELFNTDKYEQLQKILKEEAGKYFKLLDDSEKSINQYLNGLNFGENEPEMFENLKKSGNVSESDLVILKNLVEKDEKALKTLLSEEKTLLKEKEENSLKLQKAEKYYSTENELKEKESLLSVRTEQLKKSVCASEEAQKKAEEIPELTKEANLIEASIKQYSEIEEKEKALKEKSEKAADLEGNCKNLEKEQAEAKNLAAEKEAELKKLGSAGENRLKYEKELSEKEGLSENLKELKTKLGAARAAKSDSEIKAAKAKADSEAYEAADRIYMEKRRLFHMEQAGILAETLEEEKPCPVCGAVHHPNPAKKSSEAPSEQEVNLLEEKMKKAGDAENESSSFAAAAKQKAETLEAELKSDFEKYMKGVSFDSPEAETEINGKITELAERTGELKKAIAEEEKNERMKHDLEAAIPELREKADNISVTLEKARQELAALNAEIKTETEAVKDARSKLQFETKTKAEQKFLYLTLTVKQINLSLKKAEDEVKNTENEISGLKGNIDALKKELTSLEKQDLEMLKAKGRELEGKISEIRENQDSANQRIGRNKENVENLAVKVEERKKLAEKYNMVSSLSNVCSGQLSGQDKLSLEIFVQCAVLDRITKHANRRLMIMTNHQYELVRREESTNRTRKFGLDLDVLDHHTGKQRSVESLSGGEQFQASLSLALGLADEIQRSSGGIRLDSMFIDEGFGTLDTETLDKAMRALDDLSKGEKIIGIISHVSELEEKIDRKIVVKKDVTGKSHLEIKGV